MVQAQQYRKTAKPEKPRADFPLFPLTNGQPTKKIRGRLHYFGIEWRSALNRYLDINDDLLDGRTPPTTPDATSLSELVEGFLASKRKLADAGELSDTINQTIEHPSHAQKIPGVWGLAPKETMKMETTKPTLN